MSRASQSFTAESLVLKTKLLGRLPARYAIAMVGCSAMTVIFMMTVNLHIIIPRMLIHTKTKQQGLEKSRSRVWMYKQHPSKRCDQPAGRNITLDFNDGVIFHEPLNEGLMESSYYWTYLALEIPGGYLADRCMKMTMFAAILLNMVGAVSMPILATQQHIGVVVARMVQGAGGAMSISCMHSLLANWAPKDDKQLMTGIVYSGVPLGIVIGYDLSGLLLKYCYWDTVFYIESSLCLPVLFFWWFLVADSPETAKYIKPRERRYLVLSLREEIAGHGRFGHVPFKYMCRSKAFWAIFIAHTCHCCGFYLMMLKFPFFCLTMLGHNDSFLSSVPFVIMWVICLLSGMFWNYMEAQNFVSPLTVRKANTFVSSVLPIVCFTMMLFFICDVQVVFAMTCIAAGAMALSFGGFFSNHVDISPRSAGVLVAITNSAGTLPAIILPIFVNHLVTMTDPANVWSLIFGLTIVWYAIEALVYVIFANVGVDSWNVYVQDAH